MVTACQYLTELGPLMSGLNPHTDLGNRESLISFCDRKNSISASFSEVISIGTASRLQPRSTLGDFALAGSPPLLVPFCPTAPGSCSGREDGGLDREISESQFPGEVMSLLSDRMGLKASWRGLCEGE